MKIRKINGICATGAIPLIMAFPTAPALAAERVLEEVLVSAQRRTQNLQEVPIAVTAFGEEALKNISTINLQELTEFVSGAELFDDRGAGQPTWVIRGVGLADFNSNNTPTAAIYYDEMYLASNVLGGIGLFDTAQVEVLKGPQGGLYGRNTTGGAVRVLSRRAEVGEDLNGYVTASYGRWDRTWMEAAVGGSLSDTTALRISAMTDQNGGWQDSLATPGDDDFGDRDFTAVRAQLVFEPAETFDLWLKVEGGEDNSETTLGYARALFDGETGDFCASAYAGKHDERNCLAWSNITNLFALTPGEPGVLPSLQKKDGSKVLSKPLNKLNNNWLGVNLQFNWDVGFATLTSISSYLDYDNEQTYDFDAQPPTLFEEDGSADLDSWSQEFRLISSSDGPLDWLAGASYAQDNDDEDRLGDLRDNVLLFSTLGRRGFKQEVESWAVYGQADYAFNQAWVVNGSVRYTDQTSDLKDAFFEDLSGGFDYYRNVSKSVDLGDNWSGHIGLNWSPTDDAMIYARVTRGFKAGGFFGGFAFTPEELEPYEEETVTSYEIGVKTSWLENSLQLNGAAYYYDYEDIQGFTQVINEITSTVVTKLGNLGDAEHKGAELDLVWLPRAIDGLSLQLAAAYLDAEITDSNTIALDQTGLPVPIEGLKRQFAPEWSASAQARYEWNISSLLAAVQLNYSWRDDLTNEDSALSLVNLAAFSHESYGVFNARVSIGEADSRWNIALVAKNLTDEEYWARASSDDLLSYTSTPARPMSWSVEANYQW